MKKTVIRIGMVLLACFCMIGFGQPLLAADEIVIGHSGPLSGGGAKFGKNLQ